MKKLLIALLLLSAPLAYAYSTSRPVVAGVSINTSSTNIASNAYLQVIAAASLDKAVQAIQVTNGTSGAIYLATGASGSEVNSYYVIPPGVNPVVAFPIAASTRLSYKSVSGTLSSGLVTINFF